MPTPPINTTRPQGRTAMIAARTAVVGADGGRMSMTQSIPAGAAFFIRSQSSFSLPLNVTVCTRAEAPLEIPKSRLVTARRHHAGRAHGERDHDRRAAEIAGGAADQHRLARLELR